MYFINEDDFKIDTPDKLSYIFQKITWGAASIDFKGPSNCHIALLPHKIEKTPITELILGGWNNTKSVVRVNMNKDKEKVKADTPNLVSSNHFTNFYITWRKERLTVHQNGPNGRILMDAPQSITFPVLFLGVRTAWGATGKWKIRTGPQMVLGAAANMTARGTRTAAR